MLHSSQLHSVSFSRQQEYFAGWQRATAELANVQRRQEAERALQLKRIRQQTVEQFLGLADTFKAATQHVPENLKDNSWTTGILHLARQFDQTLQRLGVKQITATKKAFDPSEHEAVDVVIQPGVESGMVIEVVQPGYRLGDSVIRPAKVRVAK